MNIKRIEAKELFPQKLLQGLQYIIDDVQDIKYKDEDVDASRVETASSFQIALSDYGYEITLAQGEAVYSNYSFNRWAGWLVDAPISVEGAKQVLADFADDVLFGENHIEYGIEKS
ncbi:MAG: hypothetical protein EOO52_13275 [Gammaproteobacteria bacterium]|nr:MAG: hypothetical protein EOO52_13275 [Gammaproteobacteria bacterium]